MASISILNSPEEDWTALAPRRWQSLTDEEKLRRLRATFHHAIVGEMRNSLPCIKIGTALLAFCALDFLGALAQGTPRAGKASFKTFCTNYLLRVDQKYDCDRLWEARWRLVHNYSIEGGYSITWEQAGVGDIHLRRLHGMSGPSLVLERFIADIETAGEALFVAAASDVGIRALIIRRADSSAPISFGHVPASIP